MSEFCISLYVAPTEKSTQNFKDSMSVPDRKYQRRLSDDFHNVVISFYQEDYIRSNWWHEMHKICQRTWQKNKNGYLVYLKELYTEFMKRHLVYKVGFSSFALLRPKYCILSGAQGTQCLRVYFL